MTRVIVHSEQSPVAIKKSDLPPGEAIYVCRCGLSKSQPFCDGSHKKTLREETGRLYRYGDQPDSTGPVLIKIENL